MAGEHEFKYNVGVLVVSDTVSSGENVDRSGKNLLEILKSEKYFRTNKLEDECVSDDLQNIENALIKWTDTFQLDLILTIGGTGFSNRDVTPEATKKIIDREAPHIASRMILLCCEKTEFAALSRSICGIRGRTMILNLPGSKKGSQECFEAIANILPHALDQLKGTKKRVIEVHSKLQATK